MTGPLRRRRDCDGAMRLVLHRGLIEIRTLAYLGDGAHPDWQKRIRMIADTLHHIPGYVRVPQVRGSSTPLLLGRPGAGATWLASLWLVRYEAQEEWLVETLQSEGTTVKQLLGAKTIRRIEQERGFDAESMPR